jgi:hypothetical protein
MPPAYNSLKMIDTDSSTDNIVDRFKSRVIASGSG